VFKAKSWCPSSINLLTLLSGLGSAAYIRKIEVLDQTFRYELPRFDQTLTPVGECGIEVVIRKRLPAEIETGGRLPSAPQPSAELRRYWNQYRDDHAAPKAFAGQKPPFSDDRDL